MAGVRAEDSAESNVSPLVMVEMINPRRQFHYRCRDLLGIHKCLGVVPPDVKQVRVPIPDAARRPLPAAAPMLRELSLRAAPSAISDGPGFDGGGFVAAMRAQGHTVSLLENGRTFSLRNEDGFRSIPFDDQTFARQAEADPDWKGKVVAALRAEAGQ